jgi:hypothetical protein
MSLHAKAPGEERVFCEVCLKDVPKRTAMLSETRDNVVYFCGADCYAKWMKEHAAPASGAPLQPEAELQTGHGHSKVRDDRLKRALRQHPERDEPRIDEPQE